MIYRFGQKGLGGPSLCSQILVPVANTIYLLRLGVVLQQTPFVFASFATWQPPPGEARGWIRSAAGKICVVPLNLRSFVLCKVSFHHQILYREEFKTANVCCFLIALSYLGLLPLLRNERDQSEANTLQFNRNCLEFDSSSTEHLQEVIHIECVLRFKLP